MRKVSFAQYNQWSITEAQIYGNVMFRKKAKKRVVVVAVKVVVEKMKDKIKRKQNNHACLG